jgi:outer membrane protein
MNKILFTAALAASFIAPVAAQAQSLPAAVIAVTDLDRVTSECNACKTASAALRSQVQAFETRRTTLTNQIQTEGQSLQTAVNALGGKEPDAALKARITAFQTKQQSGAQELERSQQQIQRNQQYIQQQIAQKLGPIYQQVMQRRGANIMLETGTTLASASALDVTNEVLAALNTAMPTIATTAPAQTQTTPQSR